MLNEIITNDYTETKGPFAVHLVRLVVISLNVSWMAYIIDSRSQHMLEQKQITFSYPYIVQVSKEELHQRLQHECKTLLEKHYVDYEVERILLGGSTDSRQ